VRRVKTVRGEIRFRMICDPRFDYGRATHRCEIRDGEALFTSEGADGLVLRLHSSVPLTQENGAAVATFTLRANQTAAFILEDGRDELHRETNGYVAESFKRTLNFWRDW